MKNKISIITLLIIIVGLLTTGYAYGISPLSGATGRSSTITVANPSSSAAWKAQADYYSDGSNDASVIRSALSAAFALGGGTVQLADGLFNIASNITLQSYVNIRGAGQSATQLDATGAGIAIFAGTSVYRVEISDLFLNGNLTTGAYGIWLQDCGIITVKRVLGKQFSQSAIYSNRVSDWNNVLSFEDYDFEENTVAGIELWGASAVKIGHGISQSNHYGFYLDDCIMTTFESVYTEGDDQHAFFLNNCSGTTFISSELDAGQGSTVTGGSIPVFLGCYGRNFGVFTTTGMGNYNSITNNISGAAIVSANLTGTFVLDGQPTLSGSNAGSFTPTIIIKDTNGNRGTSLFFNFTGGAADSKTSYITGANGWLGFGFINDAGNVETPMFGVARTTLTFQFNTNATTFSAPTNADGNYLMGKARDSDTDTAEEIFRMVGASDPYMSFGASQQNKFYSSGNIVLSLPTADPHILGQMWLDTASGNATKISGG
jgi:hypothetical protein